MPMYDWLTPGTIFDTQAPDGVVIERGCEVVTMPDQWGSFEAYDSDRVLCVFSVDMVVKGENYRGKDNS